MLTLSTVCTTHRKKHQRFKVYLSFSVERIPLMAQYISDYLKRVFWIFNIDYYDFREHEQFHYLNENAICEEIDKNLEDSDIFLRFIDHGLEPLKVRLIKNRFDNIRINPFTGGISFNDDIFTYYDYEVKASFNKFGFNNRNNRFQIMPADIMIPPNKHTRTIYMESKESALDFTLRLIKELAHGYMEQQYWKRSALFWKMRDEIMSQLKREEI